MSTFKFHGSSGTGYTYSLMPPPNQLEALSRQGGNYIFASGNAANPIPVLVQEAKNIRDAIMHELVERWERAQTAYSATLFYIHIEGNHQARHDEMIDLVEAYNPAMNAEME
jgi:hypothetical protein